MTTAIMATVTATRGGEITIMIAMLIHITVAARVVVLEVARVAATEE